MTELEKKTYYENNKEDVLNKRKIYYQNNKEKLLTRSKLYNEKNKESIKNYRDSIKDKQREKAKVNVTCPICNSIVTKAHIARHKKTKKCLAKVEPIL